MIRLASVIAQFEADFMTQFRHRLSFEQLRDLAPEKRTPRGMVI